MFAKFFKRRLTSGLCFVLAATFAISSLPVGMMGGGDVAAAPIEANYAPKATYTSVVGNIHDYNDPNNTKLTDGIYERIPTAISCLVLPQSRLIPVISLLISVRRWT